MAKELPFCYGPFLMMLVPHVRHRTSFLDRDTSGYITAPVLATNQLYHVLQTSNDNELRGVLGVSQIGGMLFVWKGRPRRDKSPPPPPPGAT